MIFNKNYFYRLLSAINNNVDFIVNSIDFRYNIDNETFMQSSEIIILIGTYWQLLANLKVQDKYFNRLLCLKEHAFIFKKEVKSQPKTP